MERTSTGLSLYWGIIKRGKWLIIWGTLFCMVASAVISFLLPPVYEASMVLEVGRIYPVPEEGIKKEPEFIEEPMAMTEILQSGEFLDHTRKELGLDLSLPQMEKRLTVEQIVALTRFQRSESTLIQVSWEDTDPRLCVEVLNSLASQLIEQHLKLYQVILKTFSGRIKSLEKKILSAQKVIAKQDSYKRDLQRRIKQVEVSIAEYEKSLQKIDFSQANMNEILFFKATLNALKEQLIELEIEINKAELTIGEQEEKIQEARDWIANIEGFIGLSWNTDIRSKPVIPEEPVRPNKALNILVSGSLALLVTTLFVFFSHYAKSDES